MRCCHEHNPFHKVQLLKYQHIHHKLLFFRGEFFLSQYSGRQKLILQFTAGILDRGFGEQTAHAVTDNEHLVEVGRRFRRIEIRFGLLQRFAQQIRGIEHRIAGAVGKQPHLVVVAYVRIIQQNIHHLRPGARIGH